MNLNKAFIIGNLTRDPEVRQTTSGQVVASFGIATNRFYTDQSGQKQKQAEFHNIVAWGKLGEICGQYLHKGEIALIEGRLQTRTWQDQQGAQKSRTEIIVERIQLGPRSGGARDGGGEYGASAPSRPMQPRTASNNNMGGGSSMRGAMMDDAPPIIELPPDGDEIDIKDIPF